MKPETNILKPGEFTEELQDYKIIELERYTSKQYSTLQRKQEEIIKNLTEIKEYIFQDQKQQIERLDKRITAIEKRHNQIDAQKELKKKEKHETHVWFNKTIITLILTQFAAALTTGALIYFGLK